MMITRKKLRRLINERIKPFIPNVPDDEDISALEKLEKIDDLARSQNFRSSADSMAQTYSFPEDRSYSDDLAAYDDVPNEPARAADRERKAMEIIDIYDGELFGFDLHKHVYTAMNNRHPDDFDDFLRELAEDAYDFVRELRARRGNPFHRGMSAGVGVPKISDEQAVDIIHHVLKRESQLL